MVGVRRAALIGGCPARRALNYATPAEALNDYLVATTT